MPNVQISFTIEESEIAEIDRFLEGSGLTRSKFLALLTKSASSSIRSIQSSWETEEFDEVVGKKVPVTHHGQATMDSAISVIEAIHKIKQAIEGDA